jgi:16S rRNA processing protein RimM
VLARADGIGDRDAAAARVGWQIRVERAALPPLAPGEYYHGDVIGLPVVRRDGTLLGRVVEIHATGPVEVFVVRCEEGDRFVPSARGAIAEIGADRVVVEDGACASTF